MIRQKIEEISSRVIGTVRGIHVDTWIAFVCVISFLTISVMPIWVGRSESEIYLCFLIPTIVFLGFLSIFIRNVSLRFSWIDGVVLGWYAYAMCRFWFDATYSAGGFAIRATLMCMLYVGMRILLSGCRLSGTVIAFLIIIFAVIEAFMGYSQIISGASRHHLYPVTGSFLNPGPYSAYLAMGIACLCGLRKFNDISYILLILLALPLTLTMSRAAYLAVFVCLLIIFHDKIKGWKQWGIVISLALICVAVFYFLKSGSADGRGIINYIGIHCFLDKPLWGYGIGSFFHTYAQKTAEISITHPDFNLFNVDVIDYAFNDFLLVGVEQGIIGLFFVFALTIIVLYFLWRSNRPLFFAVLSLLIFSLFSYPFELLPYQIIGVILTAYAATLGRMKEESTQQSCEHFSKFHIVLKSIVVFIPLFFAAYICHNVIKQRLKAEKEYIMIAGLHDKAFIKDYYSLLNFLDDNKHFLFDFAKILSEQGRYNDSNDMLRRGALISNDPMFLVLQGNNYRDMEAYELAEEAYLKAWHTMPNRIYPLYQLMKLHDKMNNTEEAKRYANKILNFKEKISSPAVNDIKNEAKEIYQNEK